MNGFFIIFIFRLLYSIYIMKILVVAAMPSELKAIKEWIKSANLKVNLDIDYLCCGVWNYETISSLENYLTKNSESTFVWNIWICGYWDSNSEKKSEPIQVANVVNVHTGKEMVVPPFLQIAPLKNCFCSENVILEKPDMWSKNDEMYFDMESRWIEFIASKYKYPRLILKVPFDFIGKDMNVNKTNYKELSEGIDKVLKELPYHDYLEEIIGWINNQKNI